MVSSNVKVRIRGYAILENTRLWLKLRPSNDVTSLDYAGISKMS